MFKKLLTWPVLLVLTATFPALGHRRPPASHQASEIETLVNKAAEVLDEQGSKAFGEFRKKGGPWRYADVYLFVMDMQGIVLFNAGHPNREGWDMLNERDADGKRFHRDFVDVVSKFGSGWVDYMFPRPDQAIPTVKWSYVCATRVDGVAALVGAGVYVD
ncbi:cache domain-containing protein [Methylobacterium sp. NEAU K]|uniref:cache domain-containing protein n=1 Tax=Methylobacterium sp. NEAU K TaxID=3064946 RepID=UPI002734675B|nr:cache domain-containing protein [Methylobacterium sp. NEAU K]MDP4006762.1 cache domain-containing protein [Methylobacterium sp. NEAU K]